MAPKRARPARRQRAREHERLVRDLDRLARLQPGGTPERPLVIDSAAVVDVRAVAQPCPLCGGPLRLDAHEAETVAGTRLRVARVSCPRCGSRRAVYFRLDQPSLH